MKKIWKFNLNITDEQIVEMPDGAEILTFQVQDGVPTIWAIVDTRRDMRKRRLLIFGTGQPAHADIARRVLYVGTIQMRGLVWHLFDGYYVD